MIYHNPKSSHWTTMSKSPLTPSYVKETLSYGSSKCVFENCSQEKKWVSPNVIYR